MSEAELHVIKARLRGGILNKVRRGEYRIMLPTGLVYNEAGDVLLDPDAQITAALKSPTCFRTPSICEDLTELLGSHKRVAGYVVTDRIQGYTGKRYRFNPGRLFDRVSKRASLDVALTPHVLRHTFASLAAQADVGLYKIGQWMGHTMSEVTEIYAHLAQYDADIERLNFGGNRPNAEPTIQGKRLGQK